MSSQPQPVVLDSPRVRGAVHKLNLALFCDRWSGWLRVGVFTLAGLVLAYKAFAFVRFDFLHQSYVGYSVLALLLTVTACGAVVALRGSWFDAHLAAAWMDLHNKAGGRYMAGRRDAVYRVAAKVSLLPLFKRCLPALAFLLAVLIVPQYNPSNNGSTSAINRQIEQVNRKIEEASKVKALSRSMQKKLVRKAESLRKQAQEKPEVAAEGVYSLQKELERQVLKTATGSSSQMKKAEEFLRKAAAGQGSETETRDLLNAAKNAMQQAGGMAGLPAGLRNALNKAMKESGCSSLGQCASSGGKGISKKTLQRIAKELSKSSSSSLKKMASSCPGLSSSTSSALKKMSSGLSGLSGMKFSKHPYMGGKSGKYGRGGVDRGPGAAPLLLGDQSDKSGVKFKAVEAENKNGFELGIKLGSFRSSPDELKAEKFDGSARSGTGEPVGLGDNAGGALAPSRRKAAEQYFKSLGSED